jgi:hypothetical protein
VNDPDDIATLAQLTAGTELLPLGRDTGTAIRHSPEREVP